MMHQIVQQTTQKLLNLLPDNVQHYRVDELRSWGIPPFIVQRIQVELERNLAESMVLPSTDWANLQTKAVQNAWAQFVQAIRDEARLPSSYAKAVIETAVADVLDMLTEPRKNIPDVIFGSDDELSFDALQKRAKAVVVYQHFATLLPRYMQKKDLELLSRERCEKIIEKTDERLAANYSPLNWAQMLDPLFNLLDDQIDPTLLRLFFEDKGRDHIAAIFDRRDEALSRAEFIEILSAPDVTDNPSEAFETESPQDQDESSSWAEGSGFDTSEVSEMIGQIEQSAPKASPGKDQEVEEEQEANASQEEDRGEDEDVEDTTEDAPLNTNFSGWSTSRESTANSNGSQGNEGSITSLFSDKDERGEAEQEIEQEPAETVEQQKEEEVVEPVDHEESATEVSEGKEDDEDPIWMRFMSEDEKEALAEEEVDQDTTTDYEEKSEDDDEDSEITDDEQDEKAVVEQTGKDEDTRELTEVDKLEEQLADRHDHFVKAIFEDSEEAYNEAMQDIVEFESWREASKYIQKNIFSQNRVDLYSESAVAFTDRLQNYFLAKENRMNG